MTAKDTRRVLNFINCIDTKYDQEKIESFIGFYQIEDFIGCLDSRDQVDQWLNVIKCGEVEDNEGNVLSFLDKYKTKDLAKCS
mmetsp:Transcript_21936/g.21125  ORF Transcript_21936/g.21125 Transcript_21936/m.21125 type:complete len:83 (+) Transcript_21936:166-414(+)